MYDIRIAADQLKKVYTGMTEKELQFHPITEQVHASQRASAVNLLHYLYLRSRDLAPVQEALHLNGFSTLSNAEAYLKSQLLSVLNHFDFEPADNVPCDYFSARQIAGARVSGMFGERTEATPSIMVTFETSFAHDLLLVKKLIKAGMNVARINCAHDNEDVWLSMIKTIHAATQLTKKECRIYMDLAGPKIRTKIGGKKNRMAVEEEDEILLTDKKNVKSKLPVVLCSMPGIVQQLQPGERVFFDDGLIEATVIEHRKNGALLEVIRISSKKPYIKDEKGINFPDSSLHVSALSDFDRKCIPFIKEHADMIGYSFVHNTNDLAELHEHLQDTALPVVLKIETPEAMRNLPSLLLAAMKQPLYGVMIARGDLAVELGFENISRAQNEILNMCRAAHAPVIYATQILENMNKKGLPTRAEITDAAYGIWADCVMLNKGIHTAKVVQALKTILREKSKEISKHHPVFRPLRLSETFFHKYKVNGATTWKESENQF